MAEQTIWVKASEKQGERVAIWEVNDRHPKNDAGEREIYVAGQDQKPQEVAPTARVLDALAKGVLVQTTKAGKEKESAAPPAGGDTTNPTAPPNPTENPETTPANGQG